MSRHDARHDRNDEERGLNLAPFMNIVAILIPMLLLSVVFLKVGVIDVSSPSIAPPDESKSSEPSENLELSVAVSERGFEVATAETVYAPIDGCPDTGPTVCLADPDVDVDSKLDRARRALEQGNDDEASAALDEAVSAYDFAGLYGKLRVIQEKHPDEESLNITASPEIPYKLLVEVMDAVRFKLDKERFASNEEFWRAMSEQGGDSGRESLFSKPVLAVGK